MKQKAGGNGELVDDAAREITAKESTRMYGSLDHCEDRSVYLE